MAQPAPSVDAPVLLFDEPPATQAEQAYRILLEDSECEIVLRHEDVDRRSQEILDRYHIPTDRSPDLMAMKTSPSADVVASASTGPSSSEPSATSTSAASE